jgi:hypothetical protein
VNIAGRCWTTSTGTGRSAGRAATAGRSADHHGLRRRRNAALTAVDQRPRLARRRRIGRRLGTIAAQRHDPLNQFLRKIGAAPRRPSGARLGDGIPRAEAQRLKRHLRALLRQRRGHENANAGPRRKDERQRRQPAAARHLDIEDDDIDLGALKRDHRLAAARRDRRDQRPAALVDPARHQRAAHPRIVDQQDADRRPR